MSAKREPTAIPAEPNASDQPHDVLAAEEFAIPAPEAARPRGPVVLPDDPAGNTEPHDILAAEEFAMPAPSLRAPFAPAGAAPRSRAGVMGVIAAGLGAIAALLLRRRTRRR